MLKFDFDETNTWELTSINECKWKLKLSRLQHWWKKENYICAELEIKVFRTFASGLIMRRILIETYVWVCAPVDARADEGDELMTTLVNHEAANWEKIFLFIAFDSIIFLDYWEGSWRYFCKAYLGIDSPACRSPCNKINISKSLQMKMKMRYSGDLARFIWTSKVPNQFFRWTMSFLNGSWFLAHLPPVCCTVGICFNFTVSILTPL